jgi:small subunit ribosomal protein S4
MARDTSPQCKQCRREGQKLFLKGERCLTDKCGVERRSYPPGEHGRGRQKQSEYRVQLREKQKAKRYYGVLEKQFRTYYAKASRAPGITGENLLRMLEQRLDNIVFRAGWARTRPQARQFVNHGLIDVNGRRVDIPSFRVRKGDVVSLRSKSQQMIVIQHNLDTLDVRLPAWLDGGDGGKQVTVRELPLREQIDVPVREQLIVELYSK